MNLIENNIGFQIDYLYSVVTINQNNRLISK